MIFIRKFSLPAFQDKAAQPACRCAPKRSTCIKHAEGRPSRFAGFYGLCNDIRNPRHYITCPQYQNSPRIATLGLSVASLQEITRKVYLEDFAVGQRKVNPNRVVSVVVVLHEVTS